MDEDRVEGIGEGKNTSAVVSPTGAVDGLADEIEVVEFSEMEEAIRLPSITPADRTVSSKLVTGPLTLMMCVLPTSVLLPFPNFFPSRSSSNWYDPLGCPSFVLQEEVLRGSPVTLITVEEADCGPLFKEELVC